MSKVESVRSALRDGGPPELVRRTRLWLAGRIYPGTMPAPRKPGRKKRPDLRQRSARSVDHAHALAWFEGRRPIYERLAAAVAPYVERDGSFYDVGANIGYFTKILAETTDFHGSAHLFEPVPNLYRLCEQTLEGAPYRAHIHPFGLSDTDQEMEIFVSNQGNLGWNTIVAERAGAGMDPVRIQVRAFDSSGVTEVPSLIKIDVEGAEYLVLRGLLTSLASWAPKPAILCEIGWGQAHPHWEDELKTFAELASLGYRSTDLDGTPIDVTQIQRTTDVLFVPA